MWFLTFNLFCYMLTVWIDRTVYTAHTAPFLEYIWSGKKFYPTISQKKIKYMTEYVIREVVQKCAALVCT